MTTPNVIITYTVQQHDTLWAIAKHFYGRGDQYIRLMEANNLKTTVLKIGQVLIIPQD